MLLLRFLIPLLILLPGVRSFSNPRKSYYTLDEKIPVYANELDSEKTQLNFKYYFLKFCQPTNHATEIPVEQGVEGKLSTESTPYIVEMGQNSECQKLCRMNFNTKDIQDFAWMIDKEYDVHLAIDNLPARFERKTQKGRTMSKIGFPVGSKNHNSQYFINNHLTFKIEYVEGPDGDSILDFTIEPKSIAAEDTTAGYCDSHYSVSKRNLPLQKLEAGVPVFFSYDVEFIQTSKPLSSRFDPYKQDSQQNEIHLFSAINTSTIILILTLVIYYSLRNALGLNQELETRANIERNLKWKELSRDVFRPPGKPLLLTALVGTGVQIGTMLVLALVICCFGFIAESSWGSLLKMMPFLYSLMGVFAGYYSARLYKMFDGSEWIKCASWTAILYPSVNLLIFSLIQATPSGMLSVIALWLGISMPLVFLGSWIGYKKLTIQNPCRFSEIERPIKSQPCWLSPVTLCILTGMLPFGAVFIELVLSMISIWRDSFYDSFGYFFICLLLQAITSAEISIVMTYIQLSHENHRVWWSSFLSTGSAGLYIFGYSIFFYATDLEIASFSSSILYFGSMLAISLLFSLFCGSIGFFASHWFTRKIYGTLKISNQIELDEQKSPETLGYETFVEQSI